MRYTYRENTTQKVVENVPTKKVRLPRGVYEAWVAQWPEFCRSCGALGTATVEKHKVPCPACVGQGHCPRCAAEGYAYNTVCTACGYDTSDTTRQMYRCTYSECHNGVNGTAAYAPETYSKANRFCSLTCAGRSKIGKGSYPRVTHPKAMKTCLYCGKLFSPKDKSQKYCDRRVCAPGARGAMLKGKPRGKGKSALMVQVA